MGFQYSPKKIIGGVDLANVEKMDVNLGYSSIFSGNLIHGAAMNESKKIRFSCDFRIIRKKDYSNKPIKLSECDLWSMWFRLLTIAEIEKTLDKKTKWKFHNFPGLGYF